jgi:hypothetical protein
MSATPEAPEPWMEALRRAVEAGHYRTESATGAQEPFPWQGKHCDDCPFWHRGVCLVHGEYRRAKAHTCVYFDPCNRAEAEARTRRNTGSLDT